MTRALIVIALLMGVVRVGLAIPRAISSFLAEAPRGRRISCHWPRPPGDPSTTTRIRYVPDADEELLALAEPYWLSPDLYQHWLRNSVGQQ